jgi:two-component system, cell cycle sensor histidine kinase and response regulator CckA
MPSVFRRRLLQSETWRDDLLRVVLRVASLLGGIVYVPSVLSALKFGLWSVAVIDTVALGLIVTLTYLQRIPTNVRAACTCLVLYMLGVGLLVSVGSISQIYLFGFSLLTTLIVSVRWGLVTVALNIASMLAVGYVGFASPEMVVPHWSTGMGGWSVITANFGFVNAGVVLAVGAVVTALERGQGKLVTLNTSLEEEVRERIRTEESLVDSKALLRIAGRTARLGGWRVELRGDRLITWSDEVCDLHGMPPGTKPSAKEALAFIAPEHHQTVGDAFRRCASDGTPFDLEAEILVVTGTRLWVRMIGNAAYDALDEITHTHGSLQDITPQRLAQAEQAKLESQLLQAQKMETVGSLAGGVAHDFNNLLTVILSYSEMLLEDLPPDDPTRADLGEILGAGKRAVALTRQLLAFSRKQVLAPKVIDLSEVVGGMATMLRRLLGEDVELVTWCARGLGKTLVDPGQIEQVILNLAVNARDAMPIGGILTIETANVWLDEAYASEHPGIFPGQHVRLSVRDAGTGMDEATMARIYEPFFTTKEPGKGTGLGLATVFGIVRQSGGTIGVQSELGKGTTFEVHFPLADISIEEVILQSVERQTLRGTETILLVEDEEDVRKLTSTILRKYGYNVLDAQNGGDAFLLCEQYASPIHMLLTDVVMPRMSGLQLAERLEPVRPEMKVLYMSGYTDDAIVRHGVLHATLAFIQKPLTPEPLARKVRAVLDASHAVP